MKGIDISSYQAGLDVSSLKAKGIDFVILKIGEGRTITDKCFDGFYNAAKSAGLPVGAYFYSYATTTATAVLDAQRALSLANGRPLPLGLFIDVEDPSQMQLSDSALTDVVKAFCDTVRAGGYRPGAYGSDANLWAKVGAKFLGDDVLVWSAAWRSTPPHIQCDIWQTSNKGRIAGFRGDVDTDESMSERFDQLICTGVPVNNESSTKPVEPQPKATCSATVELPILKYGDVDKSKGGKIEGDYVELMQRRLIKKGYNCGWMGADGFYGQQTKIALYEFQKDRGLETDCVAGSATWQPLLSI